MRLTTFKEPELQFGNEGLHECPRAGITQHHVYDICFKTRKDQINVGAVGNRKGVDKLYQWLEKCSDEIDGKENAGQPNLFKPFIGFNKYTGFKAELVCNEEIEKVLMTRELNSILKIASKNERIEKCVELYYENIKFLSQNRNIDIVVCIIPKEAYDLLVKEDKPKIDEQLEDQRPDDLYEVNFRRLLKAKCLHLSKPLQLVREETLGTLSTQQDEATKAWNFCTALYYKANRTTVPWRLKEEKNKPQTCYIGIGFYRSRDRKDVHTSIAQVFDELGNGVILRGEPVQIDKNNRRPYLTEEQAHTLLQDALYEYRIALSQAPARLVIHKSSYFRDTEIAGFHAAAEERNIHAIDLVTVMDSDLRLLRDGQYPVRRGSYLELDQSNAVLYTRGSVEHYRTYPGMYIPQPLGIRVYDADTSIESISKEILSLTKMNWNNTQYDGKYPISLQCARKVGEIMKYLGEEEKPEINYSFYM